MVNHTSILIISVLIVIIPQLGFPNTWQRNIISGLAVLIIVLMIRAMRSEGNVPSGAGDTYVESPRAESSHTHNENNS